MGHERKRGQGGRARGAQGRPVPAGGAVGAIIRPELQIRLDVWDDDSTVLEVLEKTKAQTSTDQALPWNFPGFYNTFETVILSVMADSSHNLSYRLSKILLYQDVRFRFMDD
jgi:hypothetical protein